ncbi:hypothetical protein ACVWYF_000242 [Hymenobacter sp. UYAg731]
MSKLTYSSLRMAFLLFFIFCALSGKAQHWNRVSIDDSTTVDFPGHVKRKKSVEKSVETLACFYQDEKAVYLTALQHDAYGGNPIATELTQFYDEALKGTLSAAGGGQIIAQKPFTVNGFNGIEAQYETPNKPDLPRVKFVRLLIANGTFYSQSFWTNSEQDPEIIERRNHFFSSFHTEVKMTAPVDPETQTRAYKLGSLMGSLVFYGALVAIFVAIVRRYSKPKSA